MNPSVILRKQLSYFIGSDEESPIYLFRSPASPMLGHERAAIILRRMEVLSWVFMILVPLWILADIMIFPTEIVTKLVFGRVLATLCLGMLLIFSLVLMKRATWLVSYLSLLFLMAIPALFELYAQPIFTTWQLSHAHISETQAAAIFLYRQLPIIYISGLALFPLTLFESLPIVVVTSAIAAMVDMNGINLHSLHAAHWASLWVVFVTGGTAILAGVLQFNLFWHNHRLADFDAETGLMKRETALEWLRLLWNDKSRQGQCLGISLMALPQLAADARNDQAGTRLLPNEGEFLKVHLLPGMHGVRWSTQQLGVISLGHTQQQLENMMNATYGQTATLTGSHGNRKFAVAERTTDHSVGPLNLLSIAEKKLRHAIASG